MYCTKCGAQLNDNMMVCPSCGCSIAKQIVSDVQETMRQPVRSKQESAELQTQEAQPLKERTAARTSSANGNTIWSNLLSQMKAFFSSKPTKGVDLAAKSTSLEWIVYLASYFVILTFSLAINLYGMLKGLYLFGSPNFGMCLLRSFGVPMLAEGIIFGATYLYMAVIQKNRANIMSVLNIVGYSLIPMLLVAIANMVLGLIWLPLVIFAYVIGIFARSMLLYYAIRKSGNGKPFSQPLYFAVYAASKFLIVIFSYLILLS